MGCARKLAICFVVSCFCVVTAWAQDSANIVGTVKDTSGAVIPGATVTISNPAKGFTRVLKTNSAGAYAEPAIPLGTYSVTAEAPGFPQMVRTGITLAVGQIQRVDMQLRVGAITQSVTVAGNVPHVQTDTAAVSSVVTGKQITQLELNGRNFVSLALLVPGAAPDNGLITSAVGVYSNVSISFNGVPETYNNWELDGGNNIDEGSSSTLNTYPNLDAIGEFRISTSNYGADLGRHAGAVIETATKSGTNHFHGDLLEFLRNDALDANDWFANRQINPPGGNAPKTPLKWNEYGWTLGGPLYIPGHYNTSKSKTFFFWSEDWRKYEQGQVLSADVPTLRMRQGDFSECDKTMPDYNPVVAAGCTVPINPAAKKPFAGDIVPIDPNAKALLNELIPLPNNGVLGRITAPSAPTNWREDLVRIDQNISDKTSAFVRFSNDAWNTVVTPAIWSGSSNLDSMRTPFIGPGKSAVFHLTHSFKPTLLNEFIMAYTVDHIHIYPIAGPGSPAHSIDKPSSWTLTNLFPQNASNPLLPSVAFSGGTPASDTVNASFRPYFNSDPIPTMKDNLTWVKGGHSLKFGFFLEKFQKEQQLGGSSEVTQGYLRFSGSDSAITTGNGLADMYLGRIANYSEATLTHSGVPVGGYGKGHWREWDFEPYVQDDWRVTPRLTLNLGVRYYDFTVMHDVSNPKVDVGFMPPLYSAADEAKLNASGRFIPGTGYNFTSFGNGLVECGAHGVPNGCQNPLHGNVAPRFGFAFDPTGHGATAIRGGYGIYYEMGNGNQAAQAMGGNPPVMLNPAAVNVIGYNSIVAGAISPPSIDAAPADRHWPSVQQYSFSVQHQFPGNNLLEVSYVGTMGRHLFREWNLNQVPVGVGTQTVPALAGKKDCDASGHCNVQAILMNNLDPSIFFVPVLGYSTITMFDNTAISNYSSLQANYRHTFGRGLTFQAAYTWAHGLDDAAGSTDYNVTSRDLSRWYGTSSFNRTQMLVMNYIYDLPFAGHSRNGFVRESLGGWEVSGIASFLTGARINFNCGVQGFSSGIGGSVKCDPVGQVQIQKGTIIDPQFGPTPSWWNPFTVEQPTLAQLSANNQAGMFGELGRDVLTGPGRNNWDMALLKNFGLPWFGGERSTLQFRWELFNAFNHPQWLGVSAGCNGRPNTDGTPAFGRSCGDRTFNPSNGEVTSAWPARIMQFALKLSF